MSDKVLLRALREAVQQAMSNPKTTDDCPHHNRWGSYEPDGPYTCKDCGAVIPSKPAEPHTTATPGPAVVLDRLVGSRIFEIERHANIFVIIGCDGAFEVRLTSNEMRLLGMEIIQLAGNATDE